MFRVALVAVVLSAFGALFFGDLAETTLLMLTAVIAGLVCFDTSMDRQLRSRWPWVFVSLAPIVKTIPLVWFEVFIDNGLLVERYDHAGSLLFGGCVLVAVAMLARPAEAIGSDIAVFDGAVIFGSAVTAAAAGASVGYLFDRNFGSITVGRLLETPTWFVIGGLLAAVVLAATHARQVSAPLAAFLLTSAVACGLLAFTVAGRTVDRGWWALLFAGFALSAGAFGPAALGERDDRDRRSAVGIVVALVAGLIAAAAAISARSDPGAWAPGWAILGVLSLAMFALALASRPLDEPVEARGARARAQNIGIEPNGSDLSTAVSADVQDVVRAKEQALQSLRQAATRPDTSPEPDMRPAAAVERAAPARQVTIPAATSVEAVTEPPASRAQERRLAASARVEAQVDEQAAHNGRVGTTEPRVAERSVVEPTAAQPQAAAAEPAAESRVLAAAELSDSSLIATARAAAEVRQVPGEQRHAIAPVTRAHHFDPSTGLLSAAGLQHALSVAFTTSRQAGHVTIMMFTIRDLDSIEQQYGRLASAAVTSEVAERVNTLLPAGTGARFARSAYAVIFVGDLGDPGETVQRLARVLLHLRAPVEQGAVGDKIDVVAGMAQCYEGEDVANFVQRANQGLARAVQTVEPTFVAMP